MSKQFEWFDDSGPFSRANRCDPGPDAIYDGYSQWNLKRGSDFEFSNEIEKKHPDDFGFVAVLKSLTGGIASTSEKPARGSAQKNAGDISEELISFVHQSIDFTEFSDRNRTSDPDGALVTRLPIRKSSIPAKFTKQPGKGYVPVPGLDPEKMVIVGIIDDAINVAHQRFRSPLGCTRVDFAWVQDAEAEDSSAVPFGREWTREQIAECIEKHNGDDDACMQELELVGAPSSAYRPSPLNLRSSHGTFVADLAGGCDPDDPKALNRRLITVQLPAMASQDTSGSSLIAPVMAAAKYIYDRALAISKTHGIGIPVVINFSYGLFGGPRTGLHILERSLRHLAHDYELKIKKLFNCRAPFETVLPAGNAHLSRTHASTSPAEKDETQTLEVDACIKPEDRTSSYIEFWFPQEPGGTGKFQLDILPPCHTTAHTIEFSPSEPKDAEILAFRSEHDETEPDLRSVIARVKIDAPNSKLDSVSSSKSAPYWRVLVAIAPTLLFGSDRSPAPHGIWKFTASASVPQNGQIQSWIQRDEAVAGYGIRGQQPYFISEDSEEQRFDHLGDVAVSETGKTKAGVRRNGTISGLATNVSKDPKFNDEPDHDAVVVGGYYWQSGSAAIYSSAGINAAGAPQVMAPTDSSRVLSGIPSAGSRGSSIVTLNGTSVAAPQIVRLIADALEDQTAKERSSFKGSEYVSELGLAEPPRPDVDPTQEIATSDYIRRERVRYGLFGIEPATELEAQLKKRLQLREGVARL